MSKPNPLNHYTIANACQLKHIFSVTIQQFRQLQSYISHTIQSITFLTTHHHNQSHFSHHVITIIHISHTTSSQSFTFLTPHKDNHSHFSQHIIPVIHITHTASLHSFTFLTVHLTPLVSQTTNARNSLDEQNSAEFIQNFKAKIPQGSVLLAEDTFIKLFGTINVHLNTLSDNHSIVLKTVTQHRGIIEYENGQYLTP